MPLDPHVKRFLRMVAAGGIPEVSEPTPAEMRQAILRLAQAVDVKDIPIGKIENRELPGLGGPLPSPHLYSGSDQHGQIGRICLFPRRCRGFL